jgi:ABC-type branched-subunit amino acid transport system substrate-binding protein
MGRVYVSFPLGGLQGAVGCDVLRGAELARDGGLDLVVFDSFGEDRDVTAEANARRAADDAAALAYLGDFHSSQVWATAPILGAAGLLQVAPVATFTGLHGDTLVRIMPHDGVGAHAIADWLAVRGVRELLVVHDHDEGYGAPVGAMCVAAARERGLAVRARPVWDHDEVPADDLGAAEAVLYVGVAGSGAVGLWNDLHAARPELWLLGSEGVAVGWFARALEAPVAQRTRLFVANRAPLAFYGYEAMALIRDAIAAAGGDRAAVVGAARATRDRAAIIGRYSIDADGHTTSTAYGVLAVVGGALVWDNAP